MVVSEEYVKVGEREDEPWLCPTCVTRELPFVNASLSFTNSSLNSSVGINQLECVPIGMYIQELNAGLNDIVFCHLNVRSILPKIEECRSFVQQARQQLVFNWSERNMAGCNCE